MRIVSLKAINFLSFKELEIDFSDYEGVVLISGVNGSGKSSIFEAILWGLFGKTVRKSRADDVINKDHNTCEVWLVVETFNNMIEIKRRREANGTRLTFSDTKSAEHYDGTTSGKQQALEELLGFDYQYFMSTILFGGRVSSFCLLTDSERKKVLEELLGFDSYTRAYEKSKKQRNSYANQLDIYKREIANAENQIKDSAVSIESLEEESKNFRFTWTAEYTSLLMDLGKLEERRQDLLDDMLDERLFNFDVQATYAESSQEYEETQTKLKRRKRQLTADLQSVIQDMATVKERIIQFKREAKDKAQYNKDEEEGICPTCKQRLPKTHQMTIFAVQPIEDTVDKLDSKKRKLINQEERIEGELSKIENTLDEMEEPEEPDFSTLSKLRVQLEETSSHHRTMYYRLNRHFDNTDNPFIRIIKDTKIKINSLKTTIDKKKSDALEIEDYYYVADYWTKAFHYNGIPSYLLDNIFPIINKCAKVYSEYLSQGELQIDFYQDDDKMVMDIEYATGGISYDSVSTGEKTRADLSILLSIRDAIEITYGNQESPQLFLDEVFNGLDEAGTEAVMTLLRSVFKGKQVFLITHDESLKSMADAVIEVQKVNGFSKIVSST